MTELPYTPYAPEKLPAVIRRYLETPRDGDREDLVAVFAPDATVTDENVEYVGIEAIRDWLTGAASQYIYTIDYTQQIEHSPDRWTVQAHLEGDFPGGEADLRFRFQLAGDRVQRLLIAP